MQITFLIAALTLVPLPRNIQPTGGETTLAPGEIERAIAAFKIDGAIPAEGYRLQIDESGASICASTKAGAFYAGQTLRQIAEDGAAIPCMKIYDAPKFAWRGVMLDEVRHFMGKATVMRLLETMARFKLNVLHWHLTDDQGWRIPIPGYPELTQTIRPAENRRNFRDVATGLVPPAAYTREELSEIVNRAGELHIRIVPEIDMPGHSAAVLSVEHELGCFPPQEFAGGGPPDKVRNVLCPGRDATLRFCEQVLDTVCEIFPDPVVHIGGDECDRSNWKRCAHCQSRMVQNGLKDVAELQSWFTAYFCRYLASKGRRLLGWDEIAEGGLPASAMVMSWRGVSTGIAAAKGGHDVVMTPNEFCYFDYEQCIDGDPQHYPFNWAVPLPLAKVYSFDPMKGIPESCRGFVLGAQCNNWTEMTCSGAELEWKLWPRAAALAEVLWSYPEQRDFADFTRRAETQRTALRKAGVNAAPVALYGNPPPRGGLTRTAERIGYKCGATHAAVSIEDGELLFSVNGKTQRSFKDDGRFVELDVVESGPRTYFATARRDTSEIVATFRFEGETVLAKERWDWAGEDERPLDVQALIDAAAANGGGEVVVPDGQWLVKPFELRSNVTLRLSDKAELHASRDPDDYPTAKGKRCLVYAEGATNVAVVGCGLFNGHGYRFRQWKKLAGESQPQALPVMMRFSRCLNVHLEDLTICAAGSWGCHLRNCDGVVVRRLKCFSHVNNTNDGIDIESSNVKMEDCDIDADDDAVCFKTESDPSFPVTNVVVRNCRLRSCCNAVKFGTGSYGDIRDVTIENCTLSRSRGNYGFIWNRRNPGVTNRVCGIAALAVEVVDGGTLDGVTFRNIKLDGYAVPIFIREERRHDPPPGRETYLRNVLIENVTGRADSRIASSITGTPSRRPQGITLRNVDLTLPGGGTKDEAEAEVPEMETAYPDAHMFNHAALPAYGFYIRHADNVKFENVSLRTESPDARKAYVRDDCR